MVSVSFTREISAPAAEVWALISDFNGLPKFIPTITKSSMEGEGVGAIRTIEMGPDRKVVERLETLDQDAMVLAYSIVEGGMGPDYLATLSVKPLTETTCEVGWKGHVTPSALDDETCEKMLTGMYTGGLKAISLYFA